MIARNPLLDRPQRLGVPVRNVSIKLAGNHVSATASCEQNTTPESLRFVPRSIALSLEVLVETNDVPLPLRRRRRRRRRFANDVE